MAISTVRAAEPLHGCLPYDAQRPKAVQDVGGYTTAIPHDSKENMLGTHKACALRLV